MHQYTQNPEIDAVTYIDALNAEAEAIEEAEGVAIAELTESMFAAMKNGFLTPIQGTAKMTVGEAIYSLGESDGADLINTTICYLAESSDPKANEYARRIARAFAEMHIGEER